jgi:hypothetical protein
MAVAELSSMSTRSQANVSQDDVLEAAVDQTIAACNGDMRATVRALILTNNFLECEMGELKKAISQAYVRRRFDTYSG